MEKSFIKFLLLATMVITCFFHTENTHAKPAPMSIKELKDSAEIVAVVEITATSLANELATAHESGIPKKRILHQASTLALIKGAATRKEISFLDVNGLTTGEKYLVFLQREKNGAFSVAFVGNGAFIARPIAMKAVKSGLVEAAKVPTIIDLPKSLLAESGVVDRHEPSSFVWVNFAELLKHLQK